MKRSLALCAMFALLLTGCSETPKPAEEKAADKAPAKPVEPVTGRYALYQMFQTARSWAPDLEIVSVSNMPVTDVKSTETKCGAWQATFVSKSLGQARTYTYSVVEAGGNLHKGVFAGLAETYSGPRGQAKPFPIAGAKIDTEVAFEAAKKKSADYVQKHPDKPISYQLEWTARYPNPTWRVIWGESVSSSDYSVFVDAVTGEYLAKAH